MAYLQCFLSSFQESGFKLPVRKGPEGDLSAQCWLYVIEAMDGKIQSMRQQTCGPVIHTAEELVLNPKFSPVACPVGVL